MIRVIGSAQKTLFIITKVIIFFTLIKWQYSPAQESIKFTHLTIEDGLSQSTVETIIQDSSGFMWFGTEDGLNRYDGYNFTIFKNDPDDPNSISSNNIWCLFVDSQGFLWIGTFSDGLNQYDPKTEKFRRLLNQPTDSTSISSDKIRSITEDQFGKLWIGTSDGGLNRFDPQTQIFKRFHHHPEDKNSLISNTIRYVYADSDSTLWIGTNKGLNTYHIERNLFALYDASKKNTLSHNNIRHIFKDRSGKYWISTSNGLNCFDPSSETFKQYRYNPQDEHSLSSNNIRQVFEDREGRLWIINIREGVNQFDRNTEKFYSYVHDPVNKNSLSTNSVRAIYEDHGGLIWIGTLGGGLNIYNPETDQFHHYLHNPSHQNSLSHPILWAIAQDHFGNLWFGTNAGGLDKFNAKTKIYTHYLHDPSDTHSISSNNIRSIMSDHQGILWIGTQNEGIDYFEPSSQQFTKLKHDPEKDNSLSHNNVRFIYEDRSNGLWFCTWGGGLNYYDRKTRRFTHFEHQTDNSNSLSNDNVISIYQDSQYTYWVATSDGLNRLTFDETSANLLDTPNFTHYYHEPANPQSLSDNYVLCIHESKNGDLWFGTMLGLSRLRKQDRSNPVFTRYFMKNGLPNDVIYGILEDDNGYIWLSTNNGLSRFDPETETFKNFDTRDGLHNNEFNTGAYLKTSVGNFIFGGVNGASEFNPDSLIDNPYLPPVVLTSFEIYNQPAKLDQAIPFVEEVTLPYRDNHFSFEFASLDFSKPERNRYAYMLEGFDEHWIQSGSRRYASYTHIDPGTYVFKVKGTNGDGIWNNQGTLIKIIIQPPYWKTWWFMLLVILAIGGGISFGIIYRVKQLLKIERLRSKIAADLHDEIGAGLTEISIMGEIISQKLPPRPKQEVYSDLQKIGETSRNLIDSMSDIVWLVNPRRDSLFDLISRLGDRYKELLTSTNINFKTENLETLKNIRLNMEYRQNLFLIFKEAINNSLKYGNGTEINLLAEFRGRKLKMDLSDNGVGFDTSAHTSGNGLENMKSRAKSIRGTLSIESEIGQGTTVRFEGNVY